VRREAIQDYCKYALSQGICKILTSHTSLGRLKKGYANELTHTVGARRAGEAETVGSYVLNKRSTPTEYTDWSTAWIDEIMTKIKSAEITTVHQVYCELDMEATVRTKRPHHKDYCCHETSPAYILGKIWNYLMLSDGAVRSWSASVGCRCLDDCILMFSKLDMCTTQQINTVKFHTVPCIIWCATQRGPLSAYALGSAAEMMRSITMLRSAKDERVQYLKEKHGLGGEKEGQHDEGLAIKNSR